MAKRSFLERCLVDEHEWSTSEDVDKMLRFLLVANRSTDSRYRALTARHVRLICCAWCRQAWYCVPNSPDTRAVELVEEYSDRNLSKEEIEALQHEMANGGINPCEWRLEAATRELWRTSVIWGVQDEIRRAREVS